MTTAFAEIGADRLVAYLQRGDAMWSYQALRCLPALEAYRPVLLKKAAESPNARSMSFDLSMISATMSRAARKRRRIVQFGRHHR